MDPKDTAAVADAVVERIKTDPNARPLVEAEQLKPRKRRDLSSVSLPLAGAVLMTCAVAGVALGWGVSWGGNQKEVAQVKADAAAAKAAADAAAAAAVKLDKDKADEPRVRAVEAAVVEIKTDQRAMKEDVGSIKDAVGRIERMMVRDRRPSP